MSHQFCIIEDCGKPVENRDTGLCASHSKAKRQTIKEPVKRKPIKKVSEKRKGESIEYMELREAFLKAHPRCAVFPVLKSTEVHHGAGRNGANYLDTTHWKAVSHKGHVEIELNPKWAREQGFTVSRLTVDQSPTI